MSSKMFKDLASEELVAKEKELRKELFNLRFQAVSGHVENPSRIRQIKRDIARILTFARQKEEEGAVKGS
ncbi:MAG: 50S ribosomal protein L29 [Candidatus Manganitrophaceae bacterium]